VRPIGMLLAVSVFMAGLSAVALADELFFGLVTKVYRANGKIGIQLQQNGAIAGAIIDFDVLDGLPFDEVEPGDRLRFSAEQIGGVWTITRFQRQ
jgi:hypothetical protein